MDHDHPIPSEAKILGQEIAGFQMTNSHYFPSFSLEGLMAEVTSCRLVKESIRRKIFYLQTPTGGYFLKLSTLIRRKDRRRHFLLPSRKWAEWRNLHRLLAGGIATARPVMKGQSQGRFPTMFFLLTAEVSGQPLRIKSAADAANMGEYVAMLHSKGVLHVDLHPHNIIVNPKGQACLIDVQEVYFLPWIPRWLRISNLGRLYFNLGYAFDPLDGGADFLNGYNQKISDQVDLLQLKKAAARHQQRKYRSRSRRCCMNSTEFMVVKNDDWKGYRRKSFQWSPPDLLQALEKGQAIKGSHVISYRGVCIKKHPRRHFHADRCRISWKMSRALEVRGIAVPRSLGYFVINNVSCFIAELLVDKCHLNTYLSSLSDEQVKRRALKKLALWLRNVHDSNVWQRDFKSCNILCRNGNFVMVDLDGVRIRRLSENNRIHNLAQLNASVSNAITIKDRLRFYRYYSVGRQPTRQQRRDAYRKVWKITRTKNTANYDLFPDEFGLFQNFSHSNQPTNDHQ